MLILAFVCWCNCYVTSCAIHRMVLYADDTMLLAFYTYGFNCFKNSVCLSFINNFFNGNTASKYIFCVNGMSVYCIERILYHVLL